MSSYKDVWLKGCAFVEVVLRSFTLGHHIFLVNIFFTFRPSYKFLVILNGIVVYSPFFRILVKLFTSFL